MQNSNENRKRKIVVLAFTAAGHLNTILKLSKQLLKDSPNRVEIVIYGQDEYEKSIISSGARYKCYKNLKLDSFLKPPPLNDRKLLGYVYSIDHLFGVTRDILSALQFELEMEQPDLIMYDHFSLFGMWVVRSLRQKYQQQLVEANRNNLTGEQRPRPLPLCIMYHTTFAFCDPLYPNSIEKSVLDKQHWLNRIKVLYYKIKICVVQFLFCMKFGLRSEHLSPYTDFMRHKEELNLVFNLPELHPRSHMYDQNSYKFVGACIDQIDNKLHVSRSVASTCIMQTEQDKAVQDILNDFKPIDRKMSGNGEQEPILIYVSLGTIFNDNLSIFKTLIEGISLYMNGSSSANRNIKQVLVSSGGSEIHQELKEFVSKNQYSKFTISKVVPQLEVLERSSLFITHCGMNSINEAVFYGVPMVCVPLSYDQPLLAYRVADELGLGVQIDFINLRPLQVKNALEKILFNKTYQQRCLFYSEMSKKCIGQVNASEIILNYLNINKSE